MEVRGVEPRSEIKIQRTSTYIVCFFWALSCQTDKDHLKPACFRIRLICTDNRISYLTKTTFFQTPARERKENGYVLFTQLRRSYIRQLLFVPNCLTCLRGTWYAVLCLFNPVETKISPPFGEIHGTKSK